jgi:hypothetical protein
VVVDNQYHHNWLLLLGAAVLFGNATYGIVKGEVATLVSRMVCKADDPLLYWLALVGSMLLGAACVGYAVF